jgi:HD-GYP domain-containing protein (c-di-GMP phosphodiesterase class II)
MKIRHRANQSSVLWTALIFTGIAVNVLLSFVPGCFNLPIYLDTIGTICVAAVGGSFPGIVTAVLTNMVCNIFSDSAVYYGFINALIAIITGWFVSEGLHHKIVNTSLFIAVIGVISGGMGTFIEWMLFSGPQSESVETMLESLNETSGIDISILFLGVNILMNIIDKTITVCIALIMLRFIPNTRRELIRKGAWRQRPLAADEVKAIRSWSSRISHSVKDRIAIILIGVSLVLVIIMAVVGMRLYFDSSKEDKTEIAKNAARFVAEIMDPDMVDEYLRKGEDAPGYKETEEMMYRIRDNAQGVQYLYVIKIDEKSMTYIFDLDDLEKYAGYDNTGIEEGYEPGEVFPLEEEIEQNIDDFLAGKEIPPMESNGAVWNWVVTVYYPVLDDDGRPVCYAAADVSLEYMSDYMKSFTFRVVFIMAGFLILVIAFGLWATRAYLVYPINTIAMSAEHFVEAGNEQETLDEEVKKLRSVDIHTGDEVEALYNAICKMALSHTEQIRSIRRFSEATSKMQDGLIITMADLVENRDSDTGAHIQKTAAYVKIIAEGLKKKGYYAEKLTPKFMSDVVRSAPLHDVGKINIPDNVLNKPGKLTDEEYEIIKTHTIQGKKIMEKAIDTVEGEGYLKEARNMATYHHERWDGKGYPEGLHGEVIPLSARIMAVADVFDALTSPRVYKPAFPLDKALSMIEEGKGSQFDPKCVEVFMDSIEEVKVILRKYTEVVV